jgi:outer membrane biosynthesis protein TonB
LLVRGLIVAVAFLLSASAVGSDIAGVEFTPPQIVQPIENFSDCHAAAMLRAGTDAQISVTLTIAADGKLKNFSLREGSPNWMKDLVTCAVRKFQFLPATSHGVEVEWKAFLPIYFGAIPATESTGTTVESAGPLLTAPWKIPNSQDTTNCFPADTVKRGLISRIVISVTIMPDGSVGEVKPPEGSEPWMDASAHCVLERTKFYPGTRGGIPVQAQSWMPLVFKDTEGKVTSPELRSTGGELEAAYRACYPSDQLSMTSIVFSFLVAKNGHVNDPKVVKGSGDPRLDEAGACILKMLEFTPLMQNGRPMKSKVTWELPIRPPR